MGWAISLIRDDEPPENPQAPKTRGQLVYEANCAACYGAERLGVGTAPNLRGLRHRLSDEVVIKQVREGKNAMPANRQLSEADLRAPLDYLMLRDRGHLPEGPKPERPIYGFTGYPKFYDPEGYPANKPPWGTLNCLDLSAGKLLWKVPPGRVSRTDRPGSAQHRHRELWRSHRHRWRVGVLCGHPRQ